MKQKDEQRLENDSCQSFFFFPFHPLWCHLVLFFFLKEPWWRCVRFGRGSQTTPAVRCLCWGGGWRVVFFIFIAIIPPIILWSLFSSLPQLSAEGLAGSGRWRRGPTSRWGSWLAQSGWRWPSTTHVHAWHLLGHLGEKIKAKGVRERWGGGVGESVKNSSEQK